MDIVDFFNPYDKDHIIAYRHLQLTGVWPGYTSEMSTLFPMANITFSKLWQINIAHKMAEAWINYMMIEEVS